MPVVRLTKLLLLSLTWLGVLAAAPAASATVSLRYWGGPVAHSMNVHLVEWGSGVRSSYADPTTGDPGFFQYLASQSGTTTGIGGVLAQYMDTTGANSQNKLSYAGIDEITPPASGGVSGCSLPGCVDDSVIQSQLQTAIDSNTLPTPTGDGVQTMYVVLFPPGTDVCQGGACADDASGGFCAYHGSFALPSSTQVLYAAMVDNGPGTTNAGACGTSASDINNQTDIVSHELAETINDPLVAESTRNGPPMAWYDTRNGEIADICVGGANEQALNGSWTVQTIWSNRDRACVAGESAYSAPTAAFLANGTAATGESVSFDASASTDPSGNSASMVYSRTNYSVGPGLASYRWDWGDGDTTSASSSATATHTYASAGNYQVSLTVTDQLGFTSTVTHQIAVTGPPRPPAPAPTPPAPVPTPPASTGQPPPQSASPAAPPSVSTGSASNLTSSGATIAGSVNPNGVATTYQVQFGPSAAYGYSSAWQSAGAGTASFPVRVSLTGLKPRTTYHYRLVASSPAATAVGADGTFTTARALAAAPRFSFRVLRRPGLAPALRSGFTVRFTCSRACVARFSVLALPGNPVLRAGSFPLSIASGSGRLRARGSGTAVLRFSRSARTRLGRATALRLSITGVASASGTATTSPLLRSLSLRR